MGRLSLYTKKLATVFFVFLMFHILASAYKTYAQQIHLSISPPIVEAIIKPSKSILIAYNIQNYGDPTILTAGVTSFEPRGIVGGIQLKNKIEGPVQFRLDNSDLKLNQPFFLQSKGERQLLLRMRIPEGAPEGDYYYSLFVKTDPGTSIGDSSSPRGQATITSNIIITVTDTGRLEAKAKITKFDILSRFNLKLPSKNIHIIESTDIIPLQLVVENRGVNIIKPQGKITLIGNFGERAEYSLIPDNVLAKSQRLIRATPSAQIDCINKTNKQRCQYPISLFIKGFFIGIYNLSSSVNFGPGTNNIFASTTFVALPIKIVIASLSSLIIAAVIIKRIGNI